MQQHITSCKDAPAARLADVVLLGYRQGGGGERRSEGAEDQAMPQAPVKARHRLREETIDSVGVLIFPAGREQGRGLARLTGASDGPK